MMFDIFKAMNKTYLAVISKLTLPSSNQGDLISSYKISAAVETSFYFKCFKYYMTVTRYCLFYVSQILIRVFIIIEKYSLDTTVGIKFNAHFVNVKLYYVNRAHKT